MANKKVKEMVSPENGIMPGLFGQKYSSRDYRYEDSWGKNQFNSSFPASLVAYMGSKGVKPVYLCTNKANELIHKYIDVNDLLGIDPLSDDAFYSYESGYFPYEKYYTASKEKEKIDLVMINRNTEVAVSGLEVKLTTLPDNVTKDLPDSEYGSEIVVRSPTILFLACSICACYDTLMKRNKLHAMLNTIGTEIKNWGDVEKVLPHYDAIEKAILQVSSDMSNKQRPLIIQPVWKTDRKQKDFADDCLDVFVWSNLAVIQMCLRDSTPEKSIERRQRTIIWLYKMLWDFTQFEKFNYRDVVDELGYGTKTDKAFSITGNLTNSMMKCKELTKPRISKYEIKNIILGNGQKLLRPERRFDAFIVSHPELFT